MNERIVYIVAAGHSGSTLLSFILDSHPDVISTGEITHFQKFIRENWTCSCGEPLDRCGFWQRVLKHPWLSSSVPHPGTGRNLHLGQTAPIPPGKRAVQLLAAIGSTRLLRFVDAVSGIGSARLGEMAANDLALYTAVLEVSGRHVIVDSSKFFLRMKLLYLQRPEPFRIIWLMRDGRGVMASHLKRGILPADGARRWYKANRAIPIMLRTVSERQWIRVRYEDLCDHPEKEIARICRFIDVDYVESMLQFRELVHHDLGGNRMRFGSDSRIVNRETWRTTLTERELDVFERIAGRLNRALGY